MGWLKAIANFAAQHFNNKGILESLQRKLDEALTEEEVQVVIGHARHFYERLK